MNFEILTNRGRRYRVQGKSASQALNLWDRRDKDFYADRECAVQILPAPGHRSRKKARQQQRLRDSDPWRVPERL